MATDFTKNIKDNLEGNTNTETDTSDKDTKLVFVLEHKKNEKADTRAFNITMDNELIKELDKIAKRSGYSRNELISKMCQFCVDNIEIK